MKKTENSGNWGGLEGLLGASSNVSRHFVQLSSGALDATYGEQRFDDVICRYLAVEQDLFLEDRLEDGWTSFVVWTAPPPARATWQGRDIQQYAMVIMRGGQWHACSASNHWADVELCVRNDTLIEEGILDPEFLSPATPDSKCILALRTRNIVRLTVLLSAIATRNVGVAPHLKDKDSQGHLRQMLLDELFLALRNMDTSTVAEDRRQAGRAALVREAIHAIRDSDFTQLDAGALAEHLGVGRRRLERAFKDVLNVSPYQFVLRGRLTEARRILQDADDARSISALSVQLGFASVSDMAGHYQKLFDEQPSETRKLAKQRAGMG